MMLLTYKRSHCIMTGFDPLCTECLHTGVTNPSSWTNYSVENVMLSINDA